MSTTRRSAVLLVFVTLVTGNALAGTISYGPQVPSTSKTVSVDLQHENLSTPYGVAEEDFCVVLGDDVGEDLPAFVDGFGEATNSTYAVDLAALSGAVGPIVITDLGWDVTINPLGDSWYSESNFAFSTDTDPSALQPITLAAGDADGFPNDGSAHNYDSGGFVNLISVIGENLIATDGILNIEMFESFDDGPGIDAELIAGSSLSFAFRDALTFTEHTATLKFVPEPSSLALFGIAGLGLLFMRRKA